MINAISAADIYHVKFTSYCELIECSRPIRFFIVSLMYNNPNGLPPIIMAEFARWRDEVNPVAIGQDAPTLPARWSRKKFSFLPYNIYLIDFMLYRIMPEL